MPPTTLFGLGYGTGPAGYGYPPGARRPSISYPDSPFTWYDHVEIDAALPTNGGGPITNYSVLSGSLPAGVSLNATTGELTGTPTTQQSAASVVIRAMGPGGVSDTTISVEVLAMPLSLGSSLAAWYKADAGCYTDAACLFASGSGQYLSKATPTVAITNKLTIAFDIKPTSTAAHQSVVGQFGYGTGNRFLVSVRIGGPIRAYFAASGTDTTTYVDTTETLSAGTNYRIVIVYDGALSAANRVAIYIDGVAATLSITGTLPASLVASTDTLEIGTNGGGNFSEAALARLGLSSLALSGAALTAAHTSTFWASMTAARQADWFSFYNLCEASSTRVDSTGLNNLTPTNGPTVAAGPGEGLAVNNSPVKRWEDQSGLGRHLTQSTIANQPLYLTGIQNGRAVVRGDGVDDTLVTSAYSDTGAHVTLGVMAILKAAGNYPMLVTRAASGECELDYESTTRRPQMVGGPASNGVATSGAAVALDSAHVILGIMEESTSVEVRVDGVSKATDSTGVQTITDNSTTQVFARIGNTFNANADLGEVVVCQSAAAVAPTPLETYLNTRYAVY